MPFPPRPLRANAPEVLEAGRPDSIVAYVFESMRRPIEIVGDSLEASGVLPFYVQVAGFNVRRARSQLSWRSPPIVAGESNPSLILNKEVIHRVGDRTIKPHDQICQAAEFFRERKSLADLSKRKAVEAHSGLQNRAKFDRADCCSGNSGVYPALNSVLSKHVIELYTSLFILAEKSPDPIGNPGVDLSLVDLLKYAEHLFEVGSAEPHVTVSSEGPQLISHFG